MLVVGLGNPILTDDGVGWRAADLLRPLLPPTVSLVTVCVGGLALAELLADHDRVIIIDAIITGRVAPGTIHHFDLTSLPGTLNSASAHDTKLSTAISTLRRVGVSMPDDIQFVAVEALDVWTFGEECSPLVRESLPLVVDLVVRLLHEEDDHAAQYRQDEG
jgi:hydrogenase maturation protease